MTAVGKRCNKQLHQESTQESGTGNKSKTKVGELVLVLQVAKCGKDHRVGSGNCKRTGHQQQRVRAMVAFNEHAKFPSDRVRLTLLGQALASTASPTRQTRG